MAPDSLSKREFLSASMKLLPWVFVTTLAYPAGSFLFYQANTRGRVTIALKQLNEGITPFLKDNLYIYKNQHKIEVFDAHCTHKGCIIHYDKEALVFNCPCHKSRFDIEGKKLRGPAKRDLDKLVYTVTDKALTIG